MNYSRFLLAIALIGLSMMVLTLFFKVSRIERSNIELSTQITQLTASKGQDLSLSRPPVLESPQSTLSSVPIVIDNHQVAQSHDQPMLVEIKQLAMSLCDLAISEGQYDLAEQYTQIYGLSSKGYSGLIRDKRSKQQAVQQKIQQVINAPLSKEAATEPGILDQFIRFEPVESIFVDEQAIQQLMLHAYWSTEHGFIGWDLIAQHILDAADKENIQNSTLSQQLKEIIQVALGETNV